MDNQRFKIQLKLGFYCSSVIDTLEGLLVFLENHSEILSIKPEYLRHFTSEARVMIEECECMFHELRICLRESHIK